MSDTYCQIRAWARRYLRDTPDEALLPWPGIEFTRQAASVRVVTVDTSGMKRSVRGTWTDGAWTRNKVRYYLRLVERLISGDYDPASFWGKIVMDHADAAHDILWAYKALIEKQAADEASAAKRRLPP